MLLCPNLRQIFDLFWGQRERHSPQMITQFFSLPTRRDRRHALVNTPPQCNLTLGNIISLRQERQHLIARSRPGFRDSAQGAVFRESSVPKVCDITRESHVAGRD